MNQPPDSRTAGPGLAVAGWPFLVWLSAALCLWIYKGWHLGVGGWPRTMGFRFPVEALLALLAAAMMTILLTGSGRWLLQERARGIATSGGERAALWFLCGTAWFGAWGAWLGFAAVGWLTLLVPLALAIIAGVVVRGCRNDEAPPVTAPSFSPSLRALMLLFGGVAAMVVVAALAPAIQSDGLRYHLAAPHSWLRAGRFVHLPLQAHSNLPALQGLLAAPWFRFEFGYNVYQLLEAAHFVVLCIVSGALAGTLTMRLGAGAEAVMLARAAAMALSASVPVIAIVGAWPFSDVAAAAHLLGAVWVACCADARLSWRIGLASALLGSACAIKVSTLPLAAMVGLALLAIAFINRRDGLGMLLALAIVPGAFVLGPWLVKSTVYHGNPLYPAAYGVLGGDEWSPENEELYQSKAGLKGIGTSGDDLMRAPWDVTVAWGDFEAHNPGPHALAWLPICLVGVLVLTLRDSERARLLPAAALLLMIVAAWIVWFLSYQSVRFLIPHLALSIALGVALVCVIVERTGGLLESGAAGLLLLVAVASSAWTGWYWLRVDPPFAAALGFMDRDIYIARRGWNAYPAVKWLNSETNKSEPVLYIGEHRTAYARSFEPVASDWFDTPMILAEIRATRTNDGMIERWKERWIRFVLINQADLSLYEASDFRPRFSDEEWVRFEAIRLHLLDNTVFNTGDGVFIAELPR